MRLGYIPVTPVYRTRTLAPGLRGRFHSGGGAGLRGGRPRPTIRPLQEPTIATRPEQLETLARNLLDTGDLAGARQIYGQLAKMEPDNAAYVGQLGSIQTQGGDPDAGRRSLLRAVRLNPKSANLRHELAYALRGCGRLEEAVKEADAGLAIDPDHEFLIAAKSDFLWTLGRVDEAWAVIEPAVSRGLTGPAIACAFSRVCEKHGQRERGIELLRESARDTGASRGVQREARFRLGELLDRAGRYDEAFEAFRTGNELIPGRRGAEGMSRTIDYMIEEWTPEAASAAPKSAFETELPVLIVGMPRSGTTLVEQIVSSHPEVGAGGERRFIMDLAADLSGGLGGLPVCPAPESLTKAAMDRSSRAYARELSRTAKGAKRVTDKQPLNFFYLGLIDRLLPKARVIHCTRDPLDTCLSCFFTDFAGGIPVAADLSSLGTMHRAYQRLMARWTEVVTVPMLEVSYETLVGDLEGESRRMIEFLGLPWDEACLDFHRSGRVALTASVQQVRTPLYATSIGRHKHYEAHLAPLRKALAGGGETPAGGD